MIRKKSGELVRPALRPASARRRPSSMPGTPTFAKVVHFDSQLEQVRHFLQVDKPVAVSAETSPVDDHENDTEFPWGIKPSGEPISDWKLRLVNFPQSQSSQKPVRLENLSLSTSQTNLVGIVAVANLAFQKQVAARFTFDRWETVSEVVAEYSHEAQSRVPDGYDRFSFSIKLADQANLESKTLLACIRYSVSGREYWDNNSSMNYQVAFDKAPKVEKHGSRLASRPALPKSRSFRGSHKFRPHSMSSFDDFSGMGNYLSFPRPVSLPQDDSDGIEPITLARRDKQSRQAFGNRYDFGASLSATVRTQPTDDRTTVTARAKAAKETDETKVKLVVDRAEPVCESNHETAQSEPPQRSFAGKPHHDSTVYKELVDKYCFVRHPLHLLQLLTILVWVSSGVDACPATTTQRKRKPQGQRGRIAAFAQSPAAANSASLSVDLSRPEHPTAVSPFDAPISERGPDPGANQRVSRATWSLTLHPGLTVWLRY